MASGTLAVSVPASWGESNRPSSPRRELRAGCRGIRWQRANSSGQCVVSPVPVISDVPGFELDFSPLAAYVRTIVDQALSQKADFIREVVREEIASRPKPLFGMG